MKPPSRTLQWLRVAPNYLVWPGSITAGAAFGAVLVAFVNWATRAGAHITDWFQLIGSALGAGLGAGLAIRGTMWIEDRKVDKAELAQLVSLMDATQYVIDATAIMKDDKGNNYARNMSILNRSIKTLYEIRRSVLIPDFTIVSWFIQVDEAVALVMSILEGLSSVAWTEKEAGAANDSLEYLGRTLATAFGTLEARRMGTRFGDRIS